MRDEWMDVGMNTIRLYSGIEEDRNAPEKSLQKI